MPCAPRGISDVALAQVRRAAERRSTTITAKAAESPAWLGSSIGRLRELLALPRNWDSYGAEPVRVEAAQSMLDVLGATMKPDSPAPTIVPSSHGHLQAEWHTNGIDLEVEVVTPVEIHVFYRDAHRTWEKPLSSDLSELAAAVRKLGVAA
jgi:hypothetical protein